MEKHGFTQETINLLGKIPDKEISRRFGMSDTTVGFWRKELNIPPYKKVGEPVDLNDPKIKSLVPLLGKMSDADLARQNNPKPNQITYLRNKLLIAAKNQYRKPKTLLVEHPEIVTEIVKFLKQGDISGNQLAKDLGLTFDQVNRIRVLNGFPPYRNGNKTLSMTCPIDGKPFTIKFSRLEKIIGVACCSVECANIAKRKGGLSKPHKGEVWKENRKLAIERDNFTCQSCKKANLSDRQLHVHHLIPFRFGGQHTLDNLITLCAKCHREIETATNKILEANILLKASWDEIANNLVIKINGRVFEERLSPSPS